MCLWKLAYRILVPAVDSVKIFRDWILYLLISSLDESLPDFRLKTGQSADFRRPASRKQKQCLGNILLEGSIFHAGLTGSIQLFSPARFLMEFRFVKQDNYASITPAKNQSVLLDCQKIVGKH